MHSPDPIPPPQALSENPVSPFTSIPDFEFAAFVTKHRLRNDGIKDLLGLLHRGVFFHGPSTVSFRSLKDVKDALDKATYDFQEVRFSLIFNTSNNIAQPSCVVRKRGIRCSLQG
jgi:hypothetical protein